MVAPLPRVTRGKESVLRRRVSRALRLSRCSLGHRAGKPRLRRVALLLLGVVTLLLAPVSASGSPDVPDATSASISPVITGTLGANGWYTSNVTLNWVVDPSVLNEYGCDAITFVTDTLDTPRTCTADFPGGIRYSVTVHIHRDATPPVVGVTPSRAADSNGWYNHALTVTLSRNDATSGIASCVPPQTYTGPDNPSAAISGTCQDKAGNVGYAVFSFKYDATAPTIGMLEVKPGKRSAELRWRTSPDTQSVQLVRSPGLKGVAETVLYQGSATTHRDTGLRAGRKYQYRLTGSDVAGNKATRAIIFLARGALLNPAPGERVGAPPLLIWTPVKGATYYNVVLVRARRVYSAWPVRSRLQLPRAWVYHGRHHRLRPGLYRWYVWPGFGRLSAGHYGRLLGGSTFKVAG